MSCLSLLQGISDGMSCAVNEARLAVDVGYWPLYRYTPETDLPATTDEVSMCRHRGGNTRIAGCVSVLRKFEVGGWFGVACVFVRWCVALVAVEA